MDLMLKVKCMFFCLLLPPNSKKSYKKMYLCFQLNHYLKIDGNIEVKVLKS